MDGVSHEDDGVLEVCNMDTFFFLSYYIIQNVSNYNHHCF